MGCPIPHIERQLPLTQFTDLGLDRGLLKALSDEGYTRPTPIQAQAIPPVLEGRDILGIAQTGTGKTAAFALRELATQIGESFKTYGRHLGVSVTVIFGGVKYGGQMRAMAPGVDVLVATPGRLIDHLGEKTVTLQGVETFVLDEADQMLDMGFIVPIRRIVKHLPKARQNLFFSATMPTEIGQLAGELLNPNPVKVSVTPQATTVEKVRQKVIFVEQDRKRALLAELFEARDFRRVIVFTRTKRGADRVAKALEQAGVEAASIHGDKSQGQRERALAAFKAGEVRALVATDIAARGIDIDAVTHVVQYELPNVPESYVHRIGRTARAGADGSAVAFCADDERNLLKDIQKVTRQTIPNEDRRRDPGLSVMTAHMPDGAKEPSAPRGRQGQGGHRKGGSPRNGGGARAADGSSRPEGRSDLPGGLRKQRNRPAASKPGAFALEPGGLGRPDPQLTPSGPLRAAPARGPSCGSPR